MHRIGLTGGIAAGKSVVSRRLQELGAVVIDHDDLAREAVAPGTPGLAAVAAEFGSDVLNPDGSLRRAVLGELIFGDPNARHRLETILHPAIERLAAARQAAAVAENPDVMVVHDVPLLIETGQTHLYDLVVVVHAPEELRYRRLVEERGMSPADARARLAAQASDAVHEDAADWLLDGSKDEDNLRRQASAMWTRLQRARPVPPTYPGLR